MATARQPYAVQETIEIQISAQGTVAEDQAYLEVADGTIFQFQNGASFAVQIVFSGSVPEFDSITVPAGQSSSDITGTEVAVNYTIEKPGAAQPLGGPYAIQWGNGVLQVDITATTPAFAFAVPVEGNMQFVSDANYTVQWENASGGSVTAWTNQSVQVYQTPAPPAPNPNSVMQALQTAPSPVYCVFPSHINLPGKGTVHIGS